MGFDIFGLDPKEEAGSYFRANCWYWRPLWSYVISVTPDLTDLKSMMADPKYWKDGEKDPAYIKRVTDLYEKAFDKQKQ